MLDFGFSEVVVTSMIALVVLGPKKLPSVMRRIGNWAGRARVMARQLSDQLEREINAADVMRDIDGKPHSGPTPPPPPPLPPDPQPQSQAPAATAEPPKPPTPTA